MKVLMDLVKDLRLDGLIGDDIQNIISYHISQNAILETLAIKFSRDGLKDANLTVEIKNIFVTIGIFAEKEFAVLRSQKLGNCFLKYFFRYGDIFLKFNTACVNSCLSLPLTSLYLYSNYEAIPQSASYLIEL